MRQQHMIGITPAGDADWQLLKDAGIQWLRVGVSFPFEARIGGKLREPFIKGLDRLKQLNQLGFKILGDSPTPGSMRFDPQQKETVWRSSIPAWAGSISSDEYYKAVEDSCAELARRTVGLVDVWQASNEPDIVIFRGPLSDEQIVRFLLASGRGLRNGNPKSKVGINIGEMTDYSRRLLAQTYTTPDSPFDYIGLDGYFGSWQPGGPERWPAYIDEAHQRTGRPVVINEWGYSSLQSGKITDDPYRRKHYNQDVCRNKAWGKVWRSGHTPAEQAEYVGECMRIFAEHPQVVGNFFFRYGDTPACWQCGQANCPAECAWGLVDVEGRPKPAYHALKSAVAELFGGGQAS